MSNRTVNQAFATWVRRRMASAGYPTDGPRAGGPTRLAHDAGVSLSALSRVLGEGRVPEVETMRKLAPLLRTTLPEMLVRSGTAMAADFPDGVGRAVMTVPEAVDADPELSATEKAALKTHYAGLIAFARQRRRLDEAMLDGVGFDDRPPPTPDPPDGHRVTGAQTVTSHSVTPSAPSFQDNE